MVFDWFDRPLQSTIDDLTAAQHTSSPGPANTQAEQTIRDTTAKMARYRAAIDAGGDISEITGWINAAKAERAQAEAILASAAKPARRAGEREIRRRKILTPVKELFSRNRRFVLYCLIGASGAALGFSPGESPVRLKVSWAKNGRRPAPDTPPPRHPRTRRPLTTYRMRRPTIPPLSRSLWPRRRSPTPSPAPPRARRPERRGGSRN